MTTVTVTTIADQVWIALATLHRRDPARHGFAKKEIIDQCRAEGMTIRPGHSTHISSHCVANARPHSYPWRYLYRLSNSVYRLFRPGDDSHPERTGPTHPEPADLPDRYRHLVEWYENEYSTGGAASEEEDPILRMRGAGKDLWQGIDADAYVNDLRSGWDAGPATEPESRPPASGRP